MDWERKPKKNSTHQVGQGDCSCGSIDDQHPCPYLIMVDCDDETLCDCCDACTNACKMETGISTLVDY